MARVRSLYVCQQCDYSQVGWAGKCPECESWGSLVETIVSTERESKKAGGYKPKTIKKPVSLASISSKKTLRISTKISELDRVLGGGLVSGQVVLVAGEPGIGKSTILLQLAESLGNTLYISGEESLVQMKLRANRLGVKKKTIEAVEEVNVDTIINIVESSSKTFKVIVIDSIQTMITNDLSGMAGSVGQVRECSYRLVRLAKAKGIPMIIVGHVTKQGSVAGPAVLMHLVDTVLWFEGDKSLTLRMLRAIKNRFGPTDEIGIFSMEEKGLISKGLKDKLFLSNIRKNVAGNVVASVMRGTRPILVEIQSLIVPTKLAFPRRNAQGIDSKRLEMLIAVLSRRSGLSMYDFDCFVNITGGISIKNDPSADLATCMSLASAYFDKPIPKSTIIIGEVGLAGDIREVIAQEKRIKEAKRLGYKNVISSVNTKYLQEAINKYLR